MMTIKANRGDTGLARMAETREREEQDESRAEVPGLERGVHAGQGGGRERAGPGPGWAGGRRGRAGSGPSGWRCLQLDSITGAEPRDSA